MITLNTSYNNKRINVIMPKMNKYSTTYSGICYGPLHVKVNKEKITQHEKLKNGQYKKTLH